MLIRVSNTGLEPVTHGQNHALPTELITHLNKLTCMHETKITP